MGHWPKPIRMVLLSPWPGNSLRVAVLSDKASSNSVAAKTLLSKTIGVTSPGRTTSTKGAYSDCSAETPHGESKVNFGIVLGGSTLISTMAAVSPHHHYHHRSGHIFLSASVHIAFTAPRPYWPPLPSSRIHTLALKTHRLFFIFRTLRTGGAALRFAIGCVSAMICILSYKDCHEHSSLPSHSSTS